MIQLFTFYMSFVFVILKKCVLLFKKYFYVINQFIDRIFNNRRFSVNYMKRNHQSGNLHIRNIVLKKADKETQKTQPIHEIVSTKRQQYSICRSRSQQVQPITKINKLCIQQNENRLEMLTITEQFLKKAQTEKQHPIPSAFSLIKIQKNANKTEANSYQNLSFNILGCTNSKLVDIATQMVCKFGILEISSKLGVTRLVKEIQAKYHVVSYHNFAHAFSLMHMYYHLIKMDKKFKALFTKQEVGFTLIAALAHDISHPGNNNAYQVKTNSQLAVEANNEAVLQKMHIKTFFNILKAKNISILQKSKNPTKNKELIVRAILSTDVSKHFKGVEQLKMLRQKKQFDPKNVQHRNFALEQAFHACDIGNPCLEFQDYINWASLLTYEFDYQTALEAKKGVEVTQMLKYKGIKQFYVGQTGFINFLCFPLWKQLSEVWQGFKPLVVNLENNLKILKQKQEIVANN